MSVLPGLVFFHTHKMSDEGQIVMGRNHIQAVERQNCSGFGEEDGIVQPRCLTGKEKGAAEVTQLVAGEAAI